MKFGSGAKTRRGAARMKTLRGVFLRAKRRRRPRETALDTSQLIAGKRVFALGHVFWGKKCVHSVDSGSCIVCRPRRHRKKNGAYTNAAENRNPPQRRRNMPDFLKHCRCPHFLNVSTESRKN
jgi:hypothetical protein